MMPRYRQRCDEPLIRYSRFDSRRSYDVSSRARSTSLPAFRAARSCIVKLVD